MKYSVSIDVPNLDDGIRFYRGAFGLIEASRPVEHYAVLKCGDADIGIIEKAAGTNPAVGSEDKRRYERHWTPVHVDFQVDDFEKVLDRALSIGAKCEQRFDGGEHPPIAFCSDPFGNGFCIIGKKPDAIIRAVLVGGVLAGALDIGYATLVNMLRDISPIVILQSVASGVLGRHAYAGGSTSATLGIGLHFLMTIIMSLGFVILARTHLVLRAHPIVSGVAYGLVLFILMNFVVVPLSLAYPGKTPQGLMLLGALLAHVFLVGVPISLVARRYLD